MLSWIHAETVYLLPLCLLFRFAYFLGVDIL